MTELLKGNWTYNCW